MFFLRYLLLFIPMSVIWAKDVEVRLGDTVVYIRQIQHGKGPTYVHLHQNETTALKAAKTMVMRKGGTLLTLVHPGERNIVFHLNRQRYAFDPNRIFTDGGIKKTLAQNSHYTYRAFIEVKRFACHIKQLLPAGKIIAVHNNQTYSFKDYLPGHSLAQDAHQLHLNKRHSSRNFYLVTQAKDYVRLKQLHFNSVLQAKTAQDDGSLSVYLSKRQYVNVEAGYNQLSSQIQMLKHA